MTLLEFVQALQGDAGLGVLVSDRIYPVTAPQGATFPYLVYQTAAGTRLNVINGGSSMNINRVALDVWAKTYGQARQIAAAVEAALDGTGYHQSEFDDYDSESQSWRVSIDWQIME